MVEETNGHETTIDEVGEALGQLLDEGPGLHLDAAQSFSEESEDMGDTAKQLTELWEAIFTATAVLEIDLGGLDARTAAVLEQLTQTINDDAFDESATICGGVLLDCLEQWTEICFPDRDGMKTDIPL